MSELRKDGKKRCQICVGCGRCEIAVSGLHVITESFLKPELLSAGESVGKGSFVLVDIGTTTIAMELYGEDGRKIDQYVCSNPQRIFGADVISRIQAAENVMHVRQMQALVRGVLEKGLQQFRESKLLQKQKIEKMYIAGNTTMLYLLCGHDVQSLGYAPFRADFLQGEELIIGEVSAVTLPGLSAFVGGDIMAGILATGMHKKESVSLLIDLGTNGELVLGNHNKMLACSTAAGPAFEGMLQAQGKVVWGADIVAYVAELLEQGIVDETGLLQEPYFLEGVTVGGVLITQEHIRNLQTAKAAIGAGIQVLMQEYGLNSVADIEKVHLAGGFGYYLQEKAAVKIGLLPEGTQGKVQAVGNSALAGCYYYHTHENAKREAEKIKECIKVINLAEMEAFTSSFVEKMYLK